MMLLVRQAVSWIPALFFVLSSCSNPHPSGVIPKPSAGGSSTELGSGGDNYAGEFSQIAIALIETLKILPIDSVPIEKFEVAIGRTKVISKEYLVLDGHPVDALNFPHAIPPRIEVSRQSWDRLHTSRLDQVLLVFHEYLGIMELDDSDYQISHRLDAPLIFGPIIPLPPDLIKGLAQRYDCRKSGDYSFHPILGPSTPPLNVQAKFGDFGSSSLCVELYRNEGRLDLSDFVGFAPIKRLYIRGLGLHNLPERFFSQFENVRYLYISGIGDLRPSQYQEINGMPSLKAIAFEDRLYFDPHRRQDLILAAANSMRNFHCTAGIVTDRLTSKQAVYCTRAPDFPDVEGDYIIQRSGVGIGGLLPYD